MKKSLKGLLHRLPFKKRIFSILRLLPVPRNIYKHLYFKDDFKVKVPGAGSFRIRHYGYQLENAVFWKGIKGWESTTMKLWIELSKQSGIILDIGANTGIYALVSQASNPVSKIFAFEPVKRVFDKLSYNIKINGNKIFLFEKAVSSYSGKAIIYDKPIEHIYSVTVNKDISGGINSIPVEINVITLDDFIEENNLNKIDLLKIDVETHEAEVLQGFQKYLPKFKPAILVEILNDEVGLKVQELLDPHGYIYFNIMENKGCQRTEKIKSGNYYNYLAVQPDVFEKNKFLFN